MSTNQQTSREENSQEREKSGSGPQSVLHNSELEPETIALATLELWKQTVAVQMHFNDLGMRIRSFAITLIGAFLGATAIAIDRELFFSFFGWQVSGATLILVAAAVSVINFFIMDALWYQRLLSGASKEALRQEAKLRKYGLTVELTSSLKDESPVMLSVGRTRTKTRVLRSKDKLRLFYGLLLATVFVTLLGVLFTVRP